MHGWKWCGIGEIRIGDGKSEYSGRRCGCHGQDALHGWQSCEECRGICTKRWYHGGARFQLLSTKKEKRKMSKRAYETPLDRVCDTADVEKKSRNGRVAPQQLQSLSCSSATITPSFTTTYSEGPYPIAAALASNILIGKRLWAILE